MSIVLEVEEGPICETISKVKFPTKLRDLLSVKILHTYIHTCKHIRNTMKMKVREMMNIFNKLKLT